MSRFLSREAAALEPYVPGEQPKDQQYIKLNTNESPFPPSPKVLKAISRAEILDLNLYPDPPCSRLVEAIARNYELQPENVIAGNGSDEVLSFIFQAFCGHTRPAAFADVTYSFYKVWCQLYGVETKVIPLRGDFTLNVEDYMDFPGTIFIANPNAPTGISIPRADIQRLLEADPDRIVVVDEAYVDFGGESCLPMIFRYDNLLVVRTMSKSRSLAGARVGYAMGHADLIADLNRVKYSFNPYNINRLSIIAGAAAMEDVAYFEECCATVCRTRDWAAEELRALGFTVLPSETNFLFVGSDKIAGGDLHQKLRENGILARWFNTPRTRDFLRITVGSQEQMEELVDVMGRILEEA